MFELLKDVIESQFDPYLPETSICLASVNCHRIPYHVIYLCSLTLLIIVLADTPKTEWNAHADVGAKLLAVALRNVFLFEPFDDLMLGHVNEYLLPGCILGLHDEACLGLNDRASLAINDGLAVLVQVRLLVRLHLCRHLTTQHVLVHSHQLLVRVFVQKLFRLFGQWRGLLSLLLLLLIRIHHVENWVCLLLFEATSGGHAS